MLCFIIVQLKIFSNFLWFMCCLEMWYLIVQILRDFPDVLLLLIFSLVLLMSENIHCKFLYLLRLFFRFNLSFILENVPWILEKNVCYAATVGMFLTCLLGSFSPNYSSCPMFSYFFCLEALSIIESEVLKSLLLLYCCLFFPSDLLVFA